MATNIHVTADGDQWAVAQEGSEPISRFSTQQEAIDFARDRARGDGVELVVHDADGRIREKDSHGNDPREITG